MFDFSLNSFSPMTVGFIKILFYYLSYSEYTISLNND